MPSCIELFDYNVLVVLVVLVVFVVLVVLVVRCPHPTRPDRPDPTDPTASVVRCRRASNCLVIMSCTQHQKVEVFGMWSGPRNVKTMAHVPIYGILVQLVCVSPADLCESMSIAPL